MGYKIILTTAIIGMGAVIYTSLLPYPLLEDTNELKNAPRAILSEKTASWYDYQLEGIWWSKEHNTCASRDLKRYSLAKVTNTANGLSVICYVNDYGPEEWTKRDIDLSSHAFATIADLKLGLIKVHIVPLK